MASSSIKALTFQDKITPGYASFFQYFLYVGTCIVYIMTMQNVINQLSDMICECSQQLQYQRYRILSLLFMQMGFISMRIYRNITTRGNVHIDEISAMYLWEGKLFSIKKCYAHIHTHKFWENFFCRFSIFLCSP